MGGSIIDDERVYWEIAQYIQVLSVFHSPTTSEQARDSSATQNRARDIIGRCPQELVLLTQPTESLTLAIDGVAPRAKMAQQRGRRYQRARELAEECQVERSGVSRHCLFSPLLLEAAISEAAGGDGSADLTHASAAPAHDTPAQLLHDLDTLEHFHFCNLLWHYC